MLKCIAELQTCSKQSMLTGATKLLLQKKLFPIRALSQMWRPLENTPSWLVSLKHTGCCTCCVAYIMLLVLEYAAYRPSQFSVQCLGTLWGEPFYTYISFWHWGGWCPCSDTKLNTIIGCHVQYHTKTCFVKNVFLPEMAPPKPFIVASISSSFEISRFINLHFPKTTL